MISSNDSDSSYVMLASEASALALTTCSLADLAAAVRRAVAVIGHGANQRVGTRKVFLASRATLLGTAIGARRSARRLYELVSSGKRDRASGSAPR